MKIIHQKGKCIDCGACAAVCPQFWKIGEDEKASVIGSNFGTEKGEKIEVLEIKEVACNREAINVCPVNCIRIEKS